MTSGAPRPEAETTPFPPDGVDAGATNTPNPNPDAPESGQDGSGDLRAGSSWAAVEALAALLEPEAFDPDQPADETWREVTRQRALGHAATVITSGWRRVVEDDDTIERLARAMNDAAAPAVPSAAGPARYLLMARAVVRALREDT